MTTVHLITSHFQQEILFRLVEYHWCQFGFGRAANLAKPNVCGAKILQRYSLGILLAFEIFEPLSRITTREFEVFWAIFG